MADNRPNRGRGGRGGRGPNLNFELFVEGNRANLSVMVRLLRGQEPQTGTSVEFFVGTENNPYKVKPYLNDQPVAAKINSLGFGNTTLNLSGFPEDSFTHISAAAVNRIVTKPIPVEVKVPGKVAGGKRLKAIPGDERLESVANRYTLRILSVKPDGKPEASAKLRIVCSPKAGINGTVADKRDLTTDEHGWLDLQVEASGFETSLTVIHLESGESLSKRLCFK